MHFTATDVHMQHMQHMHFYAHMHFLQTSDVNFFSAELIQTTNSYQCLALNSP